MTIHFKVQACLIVEVLDDDGALVRFATSRGMHPVRAAVVSGGITQHFYGMDDGLAIRSFLGVEGRGLLGTADANSGPADAAAWRGRGMTATREVTLRCNVGGCGQTFGEGESCTTASEARRRARTRAHWSSRGSSDYCEIHTQERRARFFLNRLGRRCYR